MENIKVVLIDKYGIITDSKVKQFDSSELYKKAGFKSSDGFALRHMWTNININGKIYNDIVLYAKSKGSAGKENKYDLPPPIDKELFFGTMILVHYKEENVPESFTKKEWLKVYESLMGGFESLGEEEEEEEEYVDEKDLTKQGYKRDGFVVDDNSDEEDFGYDSELSEDDYFD
jgi:hypothetical protein